VRLQREGIPAALATIIRTTGSTPGKEPMRLLVRADGTFLGTVGGGCLEADTYAAALEVIHNDRPKVITFKLNEKDYPDSGLYCGGIVEVFVEPLTEPTVFIFGGGHISTAIAEAAKQASFRVVVGDDRPSFAKSERFPNAEEVLCCSWSEFAEKISPARHSYVIVVTRGHNDDETVLKALHDFHCTPKYLGVIGSKTKKRIIFRKLEERGVSESWLARVRTPMGIPIGARTHGEIAISVVAEMIALRRGVEIKSEAAPKTAVLRQG